MDEDGRKKIDNMMCEVDGSYPNKNTIYEYTVDAKAKTWTHWEERLRSGWKYNPQLPFYKVLLAPSLLSTM